MKNSILSLVVVLLFLACKNDPPVPQNDAAPATGQAPTTPAAGNSAASSPDMLVNAGSGVTMPMGASKPTGNIQGSNVTMRKEASVKSEKIGSFENNELVEILESKNVDNEREAILNKPITLKGSGGTINLPRGKAVVIDEYFADKNIYRVTYQDPKKGDLTAEIDAKTVETITFATWYRVKRPNGEGAWVLGKFLKVN